MRYPDQPRTVLIVDDNPELRALLAEFLVQEGFEILEAADGLEALQILKQERPDALLLDLMMPRLGGLATLERIRAFDPDVQVVIMTAALDPALLRHAVFSSATAVLSKPLHFDDIVAALRWPPILPRPETPRSLASRPASATRRILVVDDEPEIRSSIEEILSGSGYDVWSAADGQSALQAIVTERPDLVLLDVRMPGLNGIDVLASIRTLAPEVRVIMISGMTGQHVANEAFAHGVLDYIGKPIDPTYLELSVDSALAEVDGLTWATPPRARPIG